MTRDKKMEIINQLAIAKTIDGDSFKEFNHISKERMRGVVLELGLVEELLISEEGITKKQEETIDKLMITIKSLNKLLFPEELIN